MFDSLQSFLNRTGNDDRPIFIFTEAQSSSPSGSSVMQEYLQAARRLDVPIISIILTCSSEENERRLTDRTSTLHATSTKLGDSAILKTIRETEDIYRYGHEARKEVVIDTTGKDIADVASAAEEVVRAVLGSNTVEIKEKP